MTDTWWENDNLDQTYTKSLACYTPEEIYDLCERANLQITGYFPGGAMDFVAWEYHEKVALEECMGYRIKVERK
ncbi:MAG TPA: hypothetical protein VK061_05605 [Bacillota bacterium]|nr:hypothetical protein [Bacillota bacterium]